MKYKFIKNNESIFPIEKMCNVLKLVSAVITNGKVVQFAIDCF